MGLKQLMAEHAKKNEIQRALKIVESGGGLNAQTEREIEAKIGKPVDEIVPPQAPHGPGGERGS